MCIPHTVHERGVDGAGGGCQAHSKCGATSLPSVSRCLRRRACGREDSGTTLTVHEIHEGLPETGGLLHFGEESEMTEAERRRTVRVFDTTLRDGEQAPGASLGQAAKVRAAHAIADLGVDVLEAGFPAASAGEAEAVARIAREVRGPTIAAPARARQADGETAARSIGGAGRSRIHVFIATSDIHLEKKLHMTRSECLARTASAVERATAMADEIEFSAEDATRSDVAFLVSVYQEAVASGAKTVHISDTDDN